MRCVIQFGFKKYDLAIGIIRVATHFNNPIGLVIDIKLCYHGSSGFDIEVSLINRNVTYMLKVVKRYLLEFLQNLLVVTLIVWLHQFLL